MSVLIKGMEMPKNCGDCLTNYMLNVVCDCDLNNIEDGRRLPNCPLVEIPPHGRLVDADALKVNDGWLDNQDGTQTHIQFVYANDIINAPTIIETEEGEK